MAAVPASGPFFKRIGGSERFCFFHAPQVARGASPRGSILAVHACKLAIKEERGAARGQTEDAVGLFADEICDDVCSDEARGFGGGLDDDFHAVRGSNQEFR